MHHLLSLGDNGAQVLLVLKTLGVDFVDVLRPGRPGGEPAAAATTLRPPMRALFPGARVSRAVIDSPARVDALTASGDSCASRAFCVRVAGASRRV